MHGCFRQSCRSGRAEIQFTTQHGPSYSQKQRTIRCAYIACGRSTILRPRLVIDSHMDSDLDWTMEQACQLNKYKMPFPGCRMRSLSVLPFCWSWSSGRGERIGTHGNSTSEAPSESLPCGLARLHGSSRSCRRNTRKAVVAHAIERIWLKRLGSTMAGS